MFHAFDNDGPGKPLQRADWMSLLSRAPLGLMETALDSFFQEPVQWLRKPETGLMMVQGRAGATGERFNLGEVTVTRCALRLSSDHKNAAPVGVAYVLGRSHRQAQLAAMADALLQDPVHHQSLLSGLLVSVRQQLQQTSADRYSRAQSTKVEFFTVAREARSAGSEEEEK